MKRVCVFLGSSQGADPSYADATRQLGRCLSERDCDLVYGGANVGLMGLLADAVMASGGRVIGVIPEALVEKEIAHHGVSELRIVRSMHERKAVMAELSDSFLGLPGGLGTLEELFEILTWGQLGMHSKPCGLLNVSNYFSSLLEFLDRAVQDRFLKSEHRSMLLTASSPDALLDALVAYSPPRVTKWIGR